MFASEKISAKNTGIILLAAGASSRLGKPKQLLAYKGQSLLKHAVQAAIATNMHPIVIVLGAQADLLNKEISNSPADVIVNTEWQEGMASSIRCGINRLKEIDPSTEGAILMVCDQPYVSTDLLFDLMSAHLKTGKPIVACSYDNTFGPPVFFYQSLFPELLRLKGDVGARGVIRQHADDVETIPFPEGSIDVDTEADYDKILKNGLGQP